MKPEIQKLIRLHVVAKDAGYSVRVDRCAVDLHETLYYLSCVGHASAVKGLRAFLGSNAQGHLSIPSEPWFDRVYRNGATGEAHPEMRRPQRRFKQAKRGHHGYTCRYHKMRYGLWHAVFASNDPAFLINDEEVTLWQALKANRYTTPLLRGWTPHLAARLRKDQLLVDTFGFQCECALLHAKTTDFDKIVVEGLETGALRIPVDPAKESEPSCVTASNGEPGPYLLDSA